MVNPIDFEEDRIKICRLPKHRDKLWVDVIEEDRPYAEWLVSNDCGITLDCDVYDYIMDLLEE